MITAYETPAEMNRADKLQGPAELYRVLLTIKNGFVNGCRIGCYSITKAQAKKAGIEWSFLENSCAVLGLKLGNRCGRYGHMISL